LLTKDVNVFRGRSLETTSSLLRTSLSTHLVADGGARAQIALAGGRWQPVVGGGPSLHRYQGTAGRNIVEGVLMTLPSDTAMWRFDFSASSHFVPGSLRLVTGVELARDARSITVRLSGRHGERVRIEYELRR